MKTKSYLTPIRPAGLTVCLLLGLAAKSLAQTSPTPSNYFFPVVTIRATEPIATRSGQPGQFTVFRYGATNASLLVYYRIGGTASNGVDYTTIGPWVTIPAGATSNTITINPINSGQTDAVQTVNLTLAPSPLMTPVNFIIGNPSNATVYIEGIGVTNIPPVVSLVEPPDGSVFPLHANIQLLALASDPDGFVTSVQFFAGTNSLGIATNGAILDPPFPPGCGPGTRAFFLVWSNAPAGSNVLTAVATDNGGASTVSAPVNITVEATSNLPPVVRITSPPNGAVFRAPVDIPMVAFAFDPDGYVTTVEFFDGTNSLGLGKGLCLIATAGGSPTNFPCPLTNLFFLVLSNAPVGSNVLTAKATDNGGASTVSPPVTIIVLPPLPPPTNRPPVVSIFANDPIAIEGTNCWPLPWVGTWPVCLPPGPTPPITFSNFCGPKDAMFTVHRVGVTNDDITVTYSVGGTATNGVDYVALPGVVTIPAGQTKALITVVPIDDGVPDITSTVILTLNTNGVTPTNSYIVGFPSRAAAIILDGNRPRPVTGVLPDRCFHVNANGPDGAWFHIEYSLDMINWTPVCTNQVIHGAIDFVDPDAQNDQARFYRAVPEPGPPAD